MIINNEILVKNLELIKKNDIGLFNRLKNYINSGKFNLNIEKCKNNGFTFSIKNDEADVFIHSQYDSIKEAKRFISKFEFNKKDLIIAVYPGLGYHLKLLFEQNEPPDILIIAPEPAELIALLQTIELPANYGCWHIVDSADKYQIQIKFESAFNILFMNNIKYLTLGSSQRAYSEKIKEILLICSACLDAAIAKASTLSNFGEIYQSNIINNFFYFCNAPGVKTLKNKFTGMPAIIVSAGPSLDKNIDQLKKHKNKFIIIAVDTIYGKLLKNDIIPHFTVTLDPQHKSFYHFKKFDKRGFFITCLICSTKVVEYIYRDSFFFVSDYPLSLFIEGLIESKGHFVTGGGSVATIAMQFAEYIGVDCIALIGQDLSYPIFKSHCDSTMYSEDVYSSINKYKTIETSMFESIGNKLPVKGIKQTTVYTSHQLLEYLRWIKEYVNASRNHKFVNCTFDGAYIDGIEHLELEDLINKKKLKNISLDLKGVKKIIDEYKPIKTEPKIIELCRQLLHLKEICRVNRFRFQTLNDLNIFLEQNSGLFELVKTLVFSKAVKILRNNIDADERAKLMLFINIINEAIDYTIQLLEEQIKKYE